MSASLPRKHRRKKTRYLNVYLLLVTAIVVSGWLLNTWMTIPPTTPLSETTMEQPANGELDRLFTRAVQHMQRGEHEQALSLWHRLLLINPGIPEIKVNMGYSLYEMGRFSAARDSFISAMDQNAFQANAYYGLAITSERMGDLDGALGAMRSYIHLAGNGENQRFVRKARSALWEWESQLAAKAAEQDSLVNEAKPAE
jgi:tetratricopeptide (TPR) repeat protein